MWIQAVLNFFPTVFLKCDLSGDLMRNFMMLLTTFSSYVKGIITTGKNPRYEQFTVKC